MPSRADTQPMILREVMPRVGKLSLAAKMVRNLCQKLIEEVQGGYLCLKDPRTKTVFLQGMNLGECWILQVAHVAGFAVRKRLDSGNGRICLPQN